MNRATDRHQKEDCVHYTPKLSGSRGRRIALSGPTWLSYNEAPTMDKSENAHALAAMRKAPRLRTTILTASTRPTNSTPPASPRSFEEFGASTLCSSQPVPDPTPADALAITQSLRVEGNLKARRLAEEMSRCAVPLSKIQVDISRLSPAGIAAIGQPV